MVNTFLVLGLPVVAVEHHLHGVTRSDTLSDVTLLLNWIRLTRRGATGGRNGQERQGRRNERPLSRKGIGQHKRV